MEKILEYQKIDGELFKLEKQLNDNKNKQQMNKAKEVANQSKDKIIQLENDAKKTYNAFLELQKIIEINLKNVEVLNEKKLDDFTIEKVKIFEDNSNKVNNNLQILQKKLMDLQKLIKHQTKLFNDSKDALVKAKNQYAKSKELYEKDKIENQPKLDALNNQLLEKEKDLDVDLLEKYKELRKDRIYPIFVPLMDNLCGACRMEVPSARLESIKSGEKIECEHCRRIIYFKDKK